MWASEDKGHLQVPYESPCEFCVLARYLLAIVRPKKRKEKKVINKERSFLKIKLKCRCIIIKGEALLHNPKKQKPGMYEKPGPCMVLLVTRR